MEGILLTLAVLACPVAMGAMMLFMGRSVRGQKAEPKKGEDQPSVDDLRVEQRRIAAEIDRLEQHRPEGSADGELASR